MDDKVKYPKYMRMLKDFEDLVLNCSLKDVEPLFHIYFKNVLYVRGGLIRYFLEHAVIFKMLEAEGKDILDIGSGFGLGLIIFALLGARKCYGIDISDEMIKGSSYLIEDLLKKKPYLNIRIEKKDFLLTEYPQNSFNIVILKDAISHIRDTELLLDKVKKILRPRGTLYISDGNNILFCPNTIRIRKNWKRSEYGPIPEDMAKHGRKVDRISFFEARVNIIKELYPSLNDEIVKLLSYKTRGMYGDEIVDAVKEFISTGKVSRKASFPYRNPYTGEFPELGFNPFKLARSLKQRGFSCKFVAPPWTYIGVDPSVSILENVLAKAFSPILKILPSFLLPFLSPSFHIIARRTD